MSELAPSPDRWRRRLGLLLAGALALSSLIGMAPAAVAAPTGSTLTVVTVVCNDYPFIYANRARNNLQETFRNLGPDSPYFSGTAPQVAPPIEQTAPQTAPNCRPMPVPWNYTLGTGILGGTPGDLSVVTNPFPTTVQTSPTTSIPELNNLGQQTGRTLTSAVTIPLTDAQLALANNEASLWIQGGTPASRPTSQLNGRQDTYAFGALRCAHDVLNGDNVEWVQFRGDDRNVYCYAYYVSPPPDSGVIVVQKNLQDPPGGTVTFPFQGDVSFEPGGTFSVDTNGGTGATSFVRAASSFRPNGKPWTVDELPLAGYAFVSLACTSATGKTTVTTTGTNASIPLAAGTRSPARTRTGRFGRRR